MSLRPRRGRRLSLTDRRTLALGGVALGTVGAVMTAELHRVWRRSGVPPLDEAEDPFAAAAEAMAETAEVAVAGYREVTSHENAMFNLLTSFVTTFVLARTVTGLLRARPRVGPFRDLRVGDRHVHHFVPGIVLAFASGAAAIVTTSDELERWLAVPFGVGMGLTLDESALLLELDDVYWSEEGVVSVQIALAVSALLAAVALATRFLRRGEQLVFDAAPRADVENGR